MTNKCDGWSCGKDCANECCDRSVVQPKRGAWIGFGLGVAAAGAWLLLRRLSDWNRFDARYTGEGTAPKALITGASSGIGAAFARQLAARGYDLVLVARREQRLRSLGTSLTERYGVDVQVRVADLANLDELENLAHAVEEIPGLELLVNNAGFGLSGGFIQNDPRMTTDMVTVHVTAPMRLTRAALPGMLAHGRGAVINVSSMSAFLPSPKSESYAATKAALNTFSLAMARELEGKGIRVQALCPGLTHTEFHANLTGIDRSAIPELLWLTADEVARRSLEALKDGPVIFIPSPIYRLAAALISQPLLAPLVGLGAKLSAHRFSKHYLGQE